MALGRPGLEPCVPLEVRFGVVIDQRSGGAHIHAEAQCRVRFTAHCGFRECSKRFPELFTCFSTFSFLIIWPQTQGSTLTPSTLLLPCFKATIPLLLFTPVVACHFERLRFISKFLFCPLSPQVPFIIWSPQHGQNRRLRGSCDFHRQRSTSSPVDSRRRRPCVWMSCFFFSSATKTSWGGPCRRGDGGKKIKGPKGAASPVTWHLLCLYAMPPSTTQALRGGDRV